MTTTILPQSYSNVIYLQPSFSLSENHLSHLRHLTYVNLALDFPWETVFAPIKEEFLQARYATNKKIAEEHGNEMFSDIPYNLDVQPIRSPKGRKGTCFYALFKSFILAPLLYVEVMVASVHL
jgi:hypothetical protein